MVTLQHFCINFSFKYYYIYQHFSYNDVEKDTITMVLFHLLSSRHIGDEVKSRIRIAAGLGKKDHCSLYTCQLNLPHSLPFA